MTPKLWIPLPPLPKSGHQPLVPPPPRPKLKLHSVIVSYQRVGLLQETIESYLATVTLPYELMIVDNGSDDDVRDYLWRTGLPVIFLRRNHFPGYAVNIGFGNAHRSATHLHRSDSDMLYLPDWCAEVEARFAADPLLGQLGLRTDEEEEHTELNVGGTAILARAVWREGLRYDERPWNELGGTTEDYYISQEVNRRGYRWARVQRPCVVHLASGDRKDPYYRQSYGIRGI